MHRVPRVAVPFLVALLALAHVHFACAFVGIVWREAVLSWDNPATQLSEDLGSQTLPGADRAREAREHALVAAQASARAARPGPPGRVSPLAAAGRITRAPPAA